MQKLQYTSLTLEHQHNLLIHIDDINQNENVSTVSSPENIHRQRTIAMTINQY